MSEPDIGLSKSCFREYDIRGVVGESLTVEGARLLGRAVGSEARERGVSEVLVGRDARLSSPELAESLVDGLRRSGVDVLDVGRVATPVLYYAARELGEGAGVVVTGSHNPPQYNGFKVVLGGQTLSADGIRALRARMLERRLTDGCGARRDADATDAYIERLAGDVRLRRGLHVVVDCGNGVAGLVAPRLLEALGCTVTRLYCEPDGRFPHHHPDPNRPENLRDLSALVRGSGADLGLAFDGDGDRLGAVAPDGGVICADQLLMLFARDVLARRPGATVVFDVKCSRELERVVREQGGRPMLWKAGYSLIRSRMEETDAVLGGELVGHIIFRDRWYGFDDALYAAARLVEILAADGRAPAQVIDALPVMPATPELAVPMAEGEPQRLMERLTGAARFDGARVNDIDGLRVETDDAWGLVRASNTTPSLTLRFEADDDAALERIQELFRREILRVAPDLELPF